MGSIRGKPTISISKSSRPIRYANVLAGLRTVNPVQMPLQFAPSAPRWLWGLVIPLIVKSLGDPEFLQYKFNCCTCSETYGSVWGRFGPIAPVLGETRSLRADAVARYASIERVKVKLFHPKCGSMKNMYFIMRSKYYCAFLLYGSQSSLFD
jgi:hypothetical protein